MPARPAAGRDSSKSRQVEVYLEQPPYLSVSPALFQKFQKLIYAETGIWLGSAKTALLCGRLFRRLRALEISSLESYYECVSQSEQHEERARMIDAITTNETRFYREPRQFEFLVQHVFPRWRAASERGSRPKRVRVWSAGCSSGEEPYTVAMLAARYLPAEEGWDVRLLPPTSRIGYWKRHAGESIPSRKRPNFPRTYCIASCCVEWTSGKAR